MRPPTSRPGDRPDAASSAATDRGCLPGVAERVHGHRPRRAVRRGRGRGLRDRDRPPGHDDRVDLDPDGLRRSGRVGAILITVDASLPPIKALSTTASRSSSSTRSGSATPTASPSAPPTSPAASPPPSTCCPWAIDGSPTPADPRRSSAARPGSPATSRALRQGRHRPWTTPS